MNSNKFRIELDPRTSRELKKLFYKNPSIKPLLIKAIDSLVLLPFQGKALKGDKSGCYSLRKGDYRIIYEIYPYQKVILVIRVGHRRDVYK